MLWGSIFGELPSNRLQGSPARASQTGHLTLGAFVVRTAIFSGSVSNAAFTASSNFTGASDKSFSLGFDFTFSASFFRVLLFLALYFFSFCTAFCGFQRHVSKSSTKELHLAEPLVVFVPYFNFFEHHCHPPVMSSLVRCLLCSRPRLFVIFPKVLRCDPQPMFSSVSAGTSHKWLDPMKPFTHLPCGLVRHSNVTFQITGSDTRLHQDCLKRLEPFS